MNLPQDGIKLHRGNFTAIGKQIQPYLEDGKCFRMVLKPWRERRSLSQNALSHMWYSEISEYLISRGKTFATPAWVPGLMAVIAIGLMLTGHHVWTVSLLLGLWGMLATAAPTGWWTWIARTLPDNAEAGGGLMVAVIQLSIALGSTAGGIVFDRLGWQSTFAMSSVLLLCAGVLTFVTARQKAGAL
ncbi:hypothetical protein [Escherichia coli]|uniref:hypothetical protein n=1 Tax=Escherichia coli TaxID=562 RepID=UPI002815B208|nr:hypothetical protein [Escherichia coli]